MNLLTAPKPKFQPIRSDIWLSCDGCCDAERTYNDFSNTFHDGRKVYTLEFCNAPGEAYENGEPDEYTSSVSFTTPEGARAAHRLVRIIRAAFGSTAHGNPFVHCRIPAPVMLEILRPLYSVELAHGVQVDFDRHPTLRPEILHELRRLSAHLS